MTKSKAQMTGTSDHDLADLVGKKIKGITLQELDIQGDGENVRQFYTITCSDGEKFVLAVDGNNTQQYATATLMDPDEFLDLVDGIDYDESTDQFGDDPPEDDDEDMFAGDDRLFDDEEDPDDQF
jgi:hypothetical protein